jgi:glycosyltransferase involved in cell wall biosynthesis
VDILGGQAIQAVRLVSRLRDIPGLDVSLLPINPRLPSVLRVLQEVKYLRTLITSSLYLAMLLRRLPRHDVVHIFSASYLSFVLAPTPALIVSKLYRRKTVLNYRSGEAEDHLRRWGRTAIPTIRLADEVVVPSAYLVDVFAAFDLQARSIPNIFDSEQFQFRERRPLRPVFLSNRNLEPHYNVGCVLRAFKLIQDRYPVARLIVAGGGSQDEELKRLARCLGLRSVEFVGKIAPDRMGELYEEADIYLNGSDIDNMPASIIEAFACGLPVITTDVGGIPYIVIDQETGLLVPRGDHEAMASAAVRLLSDHSLATSMIQRARQECEERYCWGAVEDAWVELYTDLAGRRLPRTADDARLSTLTLTNS